MSENNELPVRLDLGLSESEIFSIGTIVSQWGAIEYEVFNQCLLSFEESDVNSLPKEMNNLSFSKVLELWKKRVVNSSETPIKDTLTAQYEKLISLQDYRNALMHGMWSWDPATPNVVTTTRVRKKEVISTKFGPKDLEHFARQVAGILVAIKYPRGLKELMMQRMEQGAFFSRKGYELLFGIDDDISSSD